jgi:phosphoribosylformylglycinamidine cyclo-ligase
LSRYEELGVDVKKRGIEVFAQTVDNLYPNAFCVVTEDPFNPGFGLVSHADSAGSKPILSYLCWKETDDPSWFKGLTQDVVAMNINDVYCVGAQPLAFVDYVAFNTILIDRIQLLRSLSQGFSECFGMMRRQGIEVRFGGGETADLPDQMRTLDVSGAIFGRVSLEKAITGQRIEPGDVIIGLRSGGKVSYETELNSGIMCNGLTLARNCLLKREYVEKYPELGHPSKNRFTGDFRVDDYIEMLDETLGEALVSPTRIFAPIVKMVLDETGGGVHGMVHNTGGGQTKCLRLGEGIGYVKDSLPEPDPIFRFIQKEAKISWREMYQDFNLGIGFEFIVDPEAVEEVLTISEKFEIGAQIIGYCEKSSAGNSLKIQSDLGDFRFP